MNLPDSQAQLILDKAVSAMAKGSGPVQKQQNFHNSIKGSLDDLAFARGADPIQFYAEAIDGSQLLQSGLYRIELALKEVHRQSVAAGSDGRS